MATGDPRDLPNADAVKEWMGANAKTIAQIPPDASQGAPSDARAPFEPLPPKLPSLAGGRPIFRTYRDPPITTLSDYTFENIREAVSQHVVGNFVGSGQLADKMTGDDRVAAVLGSRVNGLLGLPFNVKRRLAAKDQDAAKRVAHEVRLRWPRMAPTSELATMLYWGIMMGFALAELVWSVVDTKDGTRWVPTLRPWHPQLCYYRWDLRQFVVITMDGPVVVRPGDGKWVLYAPRGEYRGWMWGAVRSVASPWAFRQMFLYHWARHAQKHGKPWVLADVPASWSEDDKRRMIAALTNVGDETTVALPQVDQYNKFDVRLLEASHPAAEVFEKGVYRMDTLISCAILGQNLTTEVQGGSYAAASIHGTIRQDYLEADAKTLAECLRLQMLRPFCAYNYERGEKLLPRPSWDVMPPSDKKMTSETLSSFGNAMKTFAEAGFPVDIQQIAQEMGIPLVEGAPDHLKPPPKTVDPSGAGHPFG